MEFGSAPFDSRAPGVQPHSLLAFGWFSGHGRKPLPMYPLLRFALVCACSSVPALGQRLVEPMRIVFDQHPQVGSAHVLRFRTKTVPFNVLLFFAHNPASGAIPKACLVDPNPWRCWQYFAGPGLAMGSFRGGLDFSWRVPNLAFPVPFFAIGLDTRTFKFAMSRVETLTTRLPIFEKTIDASNPTDPHCKTLGDIDGDGFVDALAASSTGGQGLFWYDARNGWRKHRIDTGNFTVDMQVADIDSDGDLDVVIPSSTQAALLWYENPRPRGRPDSSKWKVHALGRTGWIHDVEVGDVDADGDVDVVTRTKLGKLGEVWINEGNGWTRVKFSSRPGEGVGLGDLDNDGDLDIAINGYWIETPSNLKTGRWIERPIDTRQPLDVGARVFDVNQDGRADVIYSPAESSGDFTWHEAPPNPKNGAWRRHVIETGGSFLHTFQIGDMDNDGDADFVTAEMHQSRQRRVTIHFNHHNGRSWSHQVVSHTGSHNIRLGDIDQDGDLDIFGANWNNRSPTNAHLLFWQNRLDAFKRPRPPVTRWARHVIDAQKPWRGVFVMAGDLDGDELPDVVTGGHWYRNPGKLGGTWVRRAFGGSLNNVATLADFDADGDLDVLGTDGKVVGNRFSWARNDGRGRFQIFSNLPRGGGNFLQGVSVANLRGGGNCQVALSWHTTSQGVQVLDVPTNPATTPWKISTLSATSQDEALSVGDIDRDGDCDVLLGTKWLRNDRTSFPSQTLNRTRGLPDRNRLADINGDGRLDAVIGYEATSANERVAWYEQPASSGGNWTEHVIARIIAPMSLDVGDVDNDGDMDVIAGEHNFKKPSSSRVILFENVDGAGLRWRQHVVFEGDEHHDGTVFVDLDKDGDLDVLSIGWFNPRVVIYENLGIR